jgi:hypothetical protein
MKKKRGRAWNPLEEWVILPAEAYALSYALEHLWDQKELMQYFDDFAVWQVSLKGGFRVAPMARDVEFFEALTRIALGKLADLPSDTVLEDGWSVADHRQVLRNFRARNLGIED